MRGRQQRSKGACERSYDKSQACQAKSSYPPQYYTAEPNEINDEGATMLAEALTKNRTLATLNLGTIEHRLLAVGNNRIRAEGAKALANALLKNHSLTELRLGPMPYHIQVEGNGLRAEGAKAFSVPLATNRSLRTLDICNIFVVYHA